MTKRRFLQILILAGWLALFGMIIAAGVTFRWYNSNLQPVDTTQTTKQRFEIARGASLDEVAVNLEEEGLIRDATVFKWHLKLNDQVHSLQAGVFELSPSYYGSEIAAILTSALLANVQVTIFPAQNLLDVESSLIDQGFQALDVQKALQTYKYFDHRVVKNFINQGAGVSLEGYLAPESFAVNQFSGDAVEGVIRQSLDVFAENLNDEIQAGILTNFDNVHKGIILASIVEKEVGPADRAQVAQVFIKRLHLGMKLESDVTFVYAAQIEGGQATVNHPSLYNTRIHAGLPPGPISNVSKSSLQAVAFPAQGEYLYFVSGDDDKTYFNESYEEHLQDVERYCKVKCQGFSAD